MRGPQKASVPLALKYHHVDAFSTKPLSGNGVTVFRLREALSTAVMQELTREMRQFESIFVLQKARSQTVRAWVFTMEEELDFAGHPKKKDESGITMAESKTSQLVALQGRRSLPGCTRTGESRADNRNFARPFCRTSEHPIRCRAERRSRADQR
jgi:hypothetical protein